MSRLASCRSAPAIARLRSLVLLGGIVVPGLLHAQASPSAYTTGYRYDLAGHLVGTISPDPDGSGPLHYAAIRNSYDAMGNLVRVETGELASWQPETIAPAAWSGFNVFRVEDDSYDAGGRKILVTQSAGGAVQTVTQTSYDSDDETVCVAERMNPGSFGSLPADACAQGSQGSFGPDRITHTVYDSAGRVQKIQRAYATPLAQDYETYSYTANGKVATIADANGNVATQTYDGFDRQLRWIFPSKTTTGVSDASDYEEYAYDASDNRVSLLKRDGRLINYQYDALGRMSVKDLAGAGRNVYYSYDNRGLQLAASFDAPGGQGISSSYDSLGRLVSSSTSLGGVTRTLSYQYDADGNRKQMIWPDGGYVAYDYDGLDRMTGIRENGATTIATIGYDNQGRRSGLNRGVATTSYGYDGLSRLSSLAHDLAGTSGDVTIGLGYNPASQVISQNRDNDAYAYTGELVVNRAYSVNGQNQYLAAGAATFGYDRNGNLTSDGSVAYGYDIENRLVSASGGRTANLVYDPQGRLWQASGSSAGTTTFLYDGDDLIAEYDGSGNVLRRYVHGPLTDDPLVWYEGSGLGGNRRFLFADQRGSLVSVADANGNLLSLNSYDEWGIPGAANNGRFQYTGQAWVPELGMYYYKARIYSPTLGRFLQTDPVGYKDQVNLYAYVANDPVNHADPTGTETGSVACANDACGQSSFSPSWGDVKAGALDFAAAAMDVMAAQPEGIEFKGALARFSNALEGLAKDSRAANAEVKEISISRSQHPEAAAHIERAQAAGKPRQLTVDRAGSSARRREALRGTPTRQGLDRDEYPPAMFREGGRGSSVEHINPSDNRGAGSSMSHQCRGVPNGGRVSITVCD